MEENPEDHDFDQRKDGPLQRPSVQIADDAKKEEGSSSSSGKKSRSKSVPNVDNPPSSPAITFPGRHSTQITRGDGDALPRRSTQMSRNGGPRPSRDFDRRTDGPFGRPSLTMTRRKSSGQNIPMVPTSPAIPRAATMPASVVAGKEAKDDDESPPSDQEPVSMETFQSSDSAFEPEPPPLNYTLWTRKWSITIFWSLILIDSIAMPIGLYFGLWYGTDLSPNAVFSIVTAALGGISIVEYVLRFRRLWRKGSTCRVIGARRMYLDWFHWNFSLAWFFIMVELIVGTAFPHPPIRLLSMPLTSMLFAFGTELCLIDILRYFQVPAPCRISSIPKGAQLRPGIYSIIEDVVAVDGSGGTQFREDLNKRYEASHVFRAMLRRLGGFWAFGAEAMAIVMTILIFTIDGEAAYTIGWSVPFVWAGVWTVITIWYVKKKLREEKKSWAEEVASKSNS